MNKVLAAASIGGHWIQLLRIAKPLSAHTEVVYACTHAKCATMVEGAKFYRIGDFSRWNFYKLFPAFFQAVRIVCKEKPDAVISTGAAPGLVLLLAAKCLGKRTVWIDSIANVSRLSFSGRIAAKFVSKIYTQWPDLADERHVFYVGNVLD